MYADWYRSSDKSAMRDRSSLDYSTVGQWIMRESMGLPNTPIPDPDLPKNCGNYNCTETEICTTDGLSKDLTCVEKGSRTSGQFCWGKEGGTSLAPEACTSGTACEKTYGGSVPICVPTNTSGCATGACVASYQCSGGNVLESNPGAACVRSIGGPAVCCVRTTSGDETNAEIPLELTVVPNGVSYSNVILGLEEVNGTSLVKTSSNTYTITYPKAGDGKLKKTTYTAYAQALSGSTPVNGSTSCTGGCKITLGDASVATRKITLTLSSSGSGPGTGPSVSRPNEAGFCGNEAHTAASPKESNPCLSDSHYPDPENTAGNNYCHANFAPYDYWYTCNTSTTPQPGGGKGYTTPSQEGYCATGNRANADPKWYKKRATPTCNFNNATYPLPNAPTIANDDAYCAGEFGGQNGYFYHCVKPGEGGGSTSDVICKDHKGVDGSKYPNGYFQPICLDKAPTQVNLQNGDGKFTDANAVKKPNPYASGKNYDVYLCADGTYDFAPQSGNTGVCDKYPWVQEAGGGVPTPPPGVTCPDKDKPYWDPVAKVCTFRPGACNNIGPSGKQNTCQTTACGANTPDIYPGEDPSEANLACKTYYGDGRNFCCGVPSSGGTPGGTCSNGQKDGTETDVDCGGSCSTCTVGKACSIGSDCQSSTCTGGVCTAGAGGITSTPPTPTNPVGGGAGREHSHCYNGDIDCAPQFKCNRNPGTATSYCIYRNPTDPEGDPYCKSSIYHCEAGPTCATGNPAPILGHNYSCQRAGMGNICCTGTSGSTASTGNEVRVGGTCTSNTQCLNLKLGSSCVYTNNPNVGVCR